MRFDDMIDTVLAQPLDSGPVRVNAYRQLIDLLAQGRADHDRALASRAYEAIESLRTDVPRDIRAAVADALSGTLLPVGLVAHFAREDVRDVARFLSLARLDERDWLALLPGLSLPARNVLRSRRDLPEKVVRALDAFGPSDFALAAPEEPQFNWDSASAPMSAPDNDMARQMASASSALSNSQMRTETGDDAGSDQEAFSSSARSHDPPETAAQHGYLEQHDRLYAAVRHDLNAAFAALQQMSGHRLSAHQGFAESEGPEARESDDTGDRAGGVRPPEQGPSQYKAGLRPSTQNDQLLSSANSDDQERHSAVSSRPAPSTRRRVDHLFDAPVRNEAAIKATVENEEIKGATLAGELQVRELLRRIEAFRARAPREGADQSRPPVVSLDDGARNDASREGQAHSLDEAGLRDGAAAVFRAPLHPADDAVTGEPSVRPTLARPYGNSADTRSSHDRKSAPSSLTGRAVHTEHTPQEPVCFRWEADIAGTIIWVEGIAREAVIGRSIALSGPDSVEGVDIAVATAFARRVPFRNGILNLPGSGEASGRWDISGVPFFDPRGGRFCGFRGLAQRTGPSVSAIVASSLKSSENVQAGPRRKEEALSPDTVRQMAHELRTPINAIVGFAEMIEQQILGPATQAYRDRAHEILSDAHRLLAAIDDMDAAARSATPPEQGPPLVDAGALVERVIGRYRGLSGERGIGLIGSVAIGLPAIETSEEVLERVISRLFAAVIGSAQKGDRLTYGVGAGEGDSVRVFLSRPASLSGYEVEGLYASAAAVNQAATGPSALGLGFGLRLVRQLASTLGGQFEIEETLFILSLPCRRSMTDKAGFLA